MRGATETGRPYFVMELVQGVPITEFCDKNHLSVTERIKLFIPVCQAIQSAHQKGIIHRDLKPTNILVTLNAGVPHPMVIDFGVAKATNQKLTEKTLFTNFATMIGTPAYMSPEQAEMSRLGRGYALRHLRPGGVALRVADRDDPFPGEAVAQRGLPGDAADHYGGATRTPFHALAPNETLGKSLSARSPLHAPRSTDLDWIVMKCLEKDRGRRYETANGLAMDLQRHLNNEPVVARPPSAVYRFQKAWRRNKVAFTAVAAVVAALGLGVVASSWEAVRATKARWDEVAARQRADQAARLAKTQQDRAEKEAQRAAASELAARVAETNALRQAYSANMLSACDALENAQIATARHYLESAPADLRGWEWRHLSSRLDLTTRVHERVRASYARNPCAAGCAIIL